MNIVDFKKSCESFFLSKPICSEELIIEFIKNKDLLVVNNWIQKVALDYHNEKYEVIKKFVAQARGNFDCLKDDMDKDPLKSTENQKKFNEYRDVFSEVFERCFYKLKTIVNFNIQYKKMKEEEQRIEDLNVTVNDVDYTAIAMSNIMWLGWESDSKIWIVNDNGSNKLVATSHGGHYFASKEMLVDKIKEYESLIASTKKMLDLLE